MSSRLLKISTNLKVLLGIYAGLFTWALFGGQRCHNFCFDWLVLVTLPGQMVLSFLQWQSSYPNENLTMVLAGIITAIFIYLGWTLVELISSSIIKGLARNKNSR